MKTKTGLLSRASSLLFCVALVALCVQSSNVQGKSMSNAFKEVYSGNMIYFDGTFGPAAGLRRGGRSGSGVEFFTLTINSYTPESDVNRMLAALKDGGQDALSKVLGKEKKGTLQIGTRLGRDVQAVWVTRTDEGRKISALSERWLGFGELRRGARSVDYPFTYIEIFVEEDGGKGEGSLIPAARVRSKGGNNIEIENFGIYPARLTNIKMSNK
ncbi:MAG: hypothetical protein ACREEM_27115 [Blastocatellia bacterium]